METKKFLENIWCQIFFSNFRWYRRILGGSWERYEINGPVFGSVWIMSEIGKKPLYGDILDSETYG